MTDDEVKIRQEIDEELKQEELNKRNKKRFASDRILGFILLIGGIIGWFASLEILMGKFYLLENPGSKLSCDVNPLVSCGTIMMTWQASALKIPNMALGLAGFSIMAVIGSLMISRTVLPQWTRSMVLAGMAFAFGMVHFLSVSAIFFIHALCPYCIIIWMVVAPMFFATLANTIEGTESYKKNKLLQLLRHWAIATVSWYVLVFVVIVIAFFDQWRIMFGF